MTTFFRLLDTSVDEKGGMLREAVAACNCGQGSTHPPAFNLDPAVFLDLPSTPFAYWVSERLRRIFATFPAFEVGGGTRFANAGTSTGDDLRFTRVWWEVAQSQIGARWRHYTKGGRFSPFYSDVFALVDWLADGTPIEMFFAGGRVRKPFYGRPGLTWPLRGVRFSAQAVPQGCIFSVAGKMAFSESAELPALLALFNSSVFDFLIGVSAGKVGGVQYEVGIVQNLPIPNRTRKEDDEIAILARRAWSLKRMLDTTNETSHAFVLPPGTIGYEAVPPHEQAGGFSRSAIQRELVKIQGEIDDRVFALYGIGTEDRATIEAASERGLTSVDDATENQEASEEGGDSDAVPIGIPLLPVYSWLVGVAFGRFDKRLVTGERAIPPEPEPFGPLPARSAGMWPEGEAREVVAPEILVDDPGHAEDICAHLADAAGNTGWHDAEDLRQWLAREFFPLHIGMYSKSRRKAPIYWQLAGPSASYSVWLYLHAFTKDSLFQVQNEFVAPKLAHEERRLEAMRRELGQASKASDRKALTAQEAFVEELRAFLEEVKRIAPLWNPNLDDGVIINFAPLWRLVPHHKPWQKELKATWDALCAGEYDWAHLSMHLWPERVVPRCAKDRSLAIAHGVEDVFWCEGADGKMKARSAPTRSVDELVRERSSPAVKAALKSLLDAPTSGGSSKRARKGKADA